MFEIAGRRIPSGLAEIADPAHSALLIWDMEYGIAPHAFNYSGLLSKLQELSALARRRGVRVFYSVQRPFDAAKEEAGVWLRVRMKRAKLAEPAELLDHAEDPRDSEIVAELAPRPEDVVFHKRRPDGFVGTDLDMMLRANGIKTLLIGGVATEGGVEGTARSARNLGYDVVIVKDGVGSRSRELHELAIELMERIFFEVVPAADVMALWR